MTSPMSSPPALFKRRFTRSGSLIAGLATVVAAYLGFSAPGVSPVTPAPTAASTADTSSHGTIGQSAADSTVDFVRHHHGHR
jgi:hypothetical protein